MEKYKQKKLERKFTTRKLQEIIVYKEDTNNVTEKNSLKCMRK